MKNIDTKLLIAVVLLSSTMSLGCRWSGNEWQVIDGYSKGFIWKKSSDIKRRKISSDHGRFGAPLF